MSQIFATIQTQLNLSPKAIETVDQTIKILQTKPTTAEAPAMLLGKVQSGKTRTYVGVIAKAFDAGYDIAVILTKGTVALARQTFRRMQREFKPCLKAGPNRVGIFDVMEVPQGLTGYDLRAKLLIVCKKQHDNLDALEEMLTRTYPQLAQRRVLLIDDEADFASIGFQGKADDRELRRIAGQIDQLRSRLSGGAFLQVTATPYALYLQPGVMQLASRVAKPTRPDLTVLVDPEPGYIGGQFFFEESDQEPPQTPHQIMANRVFCEVPHAEFEVLRSPDRRRVKIEEAFEATTIQHLRTAVFTFIVGGCIRHLQQRATEQEEQHYSFIVHTEVAKGAHTHQSDLVSQLVERLQAISVSAPKSLEPLVREAYAGLAVSVGALGTVPPFQAVFNEFLQSTDAISVIKVNSEHDVLTLIDDQTGELQRRTPFNIFIGGQILDRGITVGGLIGFFYGRRPNRFQADTVLQHARIYGYRPEADLAVTRLHTSKGLFAVMKRIHEMDQALREALARAQGSVVFLERDQSGQVVHCAPAKVMASATKTLTPHGRLLPVGFQTRSKTANAPLLMKLDKEMLARFGNSDPKTCTPYSLAVVRGWFADIAKQFEDEWEEGESWNWKEFDDILGYLSNLSGASQSIPCIIRRDRDVVRVRDNGRLTNQPESSQREGKIARAAAGKGPALILLRQDGKSTQGWRDCPFWWPVLITPETMEAVIYAPFEA
jgi:hypothetical protein